MKEGGYAMNFKKFAVIPAIATMFDQNEEFDEAAQRKLVKKLLSKDVDGFYIGGATGEGFLMAPEERKKVISVTIDEIGGKVPMIAYTGSNDLKTAIELSRFAEKEGADMVSSVRPYFGDFDYEKIKDYYAKLADCVNIPLLIYNNSNAQLTDLSEITDLCNIKNCCGVKYTSPNHYEMALIKKQIGEKFVFSGTDEMLASAMIAGVDGAIGSTYNVAPELYMRIRDAYEASDINTIEKYNTIEKELIHTMYQYYYLGSLKYILEFMGFGKKYLRAPNHTLTPDEEKALVTKLKLMKEKYDISDVEMFDALS